MESKSTNTFKLIRHACTPSATCCMKHFSAHVALQEATTAFQNAVLRIRKKMDYATIPWATFTDPEVAGVGITEARAKAEEIPCRVYRVGFEQGRPQLSLTGMHRRFRQGRHVAGRKDPGRQPSPAGTRA